MTRNLGSWTCIESIIGMGALAFAITWSGAAFAAEVNDPPAATGKGGAILGVAKESAGAVTVTLAPQRLREGQLQVEMHVNTHTVSDLAKYDLLKLTTLEFEGKSISPSTAPRLEGHHNSGNLLFPLEALPKAFSIKIRGLDKPELRVLSWP